ncbi:MAG: hypothetical protein NTX88_10490, partial [Candidatus Atribacteria bacterium]|nr:hypothetical protein [Candidatus Atribacteria bacterium]
MPNPRSFRWAAWILLVALFFTPFPAPATPLDPEVWICAAQPDHYFPAFLEVFLKRLLPREAVHGLINSLQTQEDCENLLHQINPKKRQLFILENDHPRLIQILHKQKFSYLPLFITLNHDLPPTFNDVPLISPRINWKEVISTLKNTYQEEGLLPHILILHQGESFPKNLASELKKNFPHSLVTIKTWDENNSFPIEESGILYIASTRDIAQTILHQTEEKGYPSIPLMVCDGSPEMLIHLENGTIKAVIDFKPSRLARDIVDGLVSSPPPNHVEKYTLTITPQL